MILKRIWLLSFALRMELKFLQRVEFGLLIIPPNWAMKDSKLRCLVFLIPYMESYSLSMSQRIVPSSRRAAKQLLLLLSAQQTA